MGLGYGELLGIEKSAFLFGGENLGLETFKSGFICPLRTGCVDFIMLLLLSNEI